MNIYFTCDSVVSLGWILYDFISPLALAKVAREQGSKMIGNYGFGSHNECGENWFSGA